MERKIVSQIESPSFIYKRKQNDWAEYKNKINVTAKIIFHVWNKTKGKN
jgi:hypothetical protein